jgi:hypothetical protein
MMLATNTLARQLFCNVEQKFSSGSKFEFDEVTR